MKIKKFSLGQILSITHEKLMCSMGGVYEILNFMTQDNLYTHQLPRASRECKPWILRQHSRLMEISLEDVNKDNWRDTLNVLEEEYGASLEIEAIPRDDHDFKEPLAELEEMVGKDKIIVIQPDKQND